MATTGLIAGRDAEVEAALTAVRSGAGAYLVGRAGVGKSRIAEEVATQAEAQGHAVVRLRATIGSSELPLGVFVTQLGASERLLTPMVTEVRERLLEKAAGTPLLLSVDDIDRLDDPSAVLIHQMVASREAALIATLRQGRIAPGEIVDLWQRGELRRLEIAPLAQAHAQAAAEAMLGRPIDPAGHQRLWEATRGNALFIREVLFSAQEAGLLADGPGGAVLTDLPLKSPRLIDSVRSRLTHLPEHLHQALVHLAFAEPCGPAELAGVAGAADLAALEAAELITTDEDDRRLVLRLAHPLYGEVLRAGTPILQRRSVLAALARDLQATGARRRGDVVKLARLAVDGGVDIDNRQLLRAAAITINTGDHVLSERIARKAFEQQPSFASASLLANSLANQGDDEGVAAMVDEWYALATKARQRTAVRVVQVQMAFWVLSDPEAAAEIVERTRAELLDAGAERAEFDELDAAWSLMTAMAGKPRAALELATPLLDHEPDWILARAALAAGHSLAAMGRPIDALELSRDVISRYAALSSEVARVCERTMLSMSAYAHFLAGDLAGARAEAERAVNESAEDLQRLLAVMTLATIEVYEGRPDTALGVLGHAASIPYQRTRGMSPRWMHTNELLAAATAGDIDLATRVDAVYRADRHPARIMDAFAEIGSARRLFASGHPEAARTVLREEIAHCETTGRAMGEVFCLYELCRLDRAEEAVGRLEALVPELQGGLGEMFAAHARAMVDNDAQALGDAAERFADARFLLFAGEAAAQASDAARRDGDQRAAARWLHRATELRDSCEAAVTHVPILDAGPVTLTRREREIAMLAAQGLASKEIGERLFISRRTAENHLAKVYDKLGVRTRSELARVVDGGVAALAG